MQLSPPVTVLAVVAVMVALTVWLVPNTDTPARTTVSISAAAYEQLVRGAQSRTGTDGQPMTVSQLVEELASKIP